MSELVSTTTSAASLDFSRTRIKGDKKFGLTALICYPIPIFLVFWIFGKSVPKLGFGYFLLGAMPLYFLGPLLLSNKKIILQHRVLYFVFVAMHVFMFNPFIHNQYLIDFSLQIVACFAFLLLLVNVIDSIELYARMIKILLFMTVIITAYLVYLHIFVFHSPYLTTHLTAEELFYKARGGKNMLSFFLALVFPFAYSRFVYRKGLMNLFCVVLIAFAALYTLSRMALLSLFVTMTLFSFLSLRKSLFIKYLLILLALLAFLKLNYGIGMRTFSLMRSSDVRERQLIDSGRKKIISTHGGHRGSLARKGLDGFLRSPLFGRGVASFRGSAGIGSVSHNDYIQILYEFGIIGFGVFLAIFATLFIDLRTVRHNVPPKYYWLYDGQLVSLLNTGFLLMLINAYETLLFWFILAGCALIVKLLKQEQSRQSISATPPVGSSYA